SAGPRVRRARREPGVRVARLLDVCARGPAATAADETARHASERLDDDRCRHRVSGSVLRREVPHHTDRATVVPPSGRDGGAAAAARAGLMRTTLAPGYDISRVLKGGWQLAGGHGAVDVESALSDMDRYVEAGITTFDCADIYTGVEELIGRW